ncbi:MAG: Flp pilus assembly protein CpaB [Actinomycetales bacterium]
MSKRILAGVAALLLAAIGAVAVLAYTRGADRRALEGQQAIGAYVVRKEVPAGTTARKAIDDGLIVKELIASKGVPEGALTSVDGSYENLIATSDMEPGELVLQSRFGTIAAAEGRLIIPEGKMAVSVALDDPSHVGPFLGVGSHIAVFDTFNVLTFRGSGAVPSGDHLQDQHPYIRSTRVLVPDVTVLAVGATTTKPSSDNNKNAGSDMQVASDNTSVTTLVTLAVTQDQASRIIHAARTGTMTFALLGADAVPTVGVGIDDTRLFNGVTK